MQLASVAVALAGGAGTGAACLASLIERVEVPAVPADRIRNVSPEPGTMLEPDSVVTVTVTAPPEGPADDVEAGMNSSHPNDDFYRSLSDAQIREDVRIRLDAGGRL